MEVTITGASGFVGRNLTQYLEEREVIVNSLSLRGDSWQYNFPKAGDAIIHLAGKAHDTAYASASEEYFKINRDLTIKLFNHFINSQIRDFIFVSSVKAAADSVTKELKEDIKPMPHTPYGKSKMEAEEYLLKQAIPKDKRLYIIRPCMIHGPGNKGNLNLLYNIIKKGIPWPLASYQNERSFLSIDNFSFLIDKMIREEKLESGIYNFADDYPLSTNELIDLMANVLEKRGKLWYIPKGFISGVAKMGDVLPLPLNSERLKKLTESYVVSNTKIKNALSLQRLPLSAKDGLIKTIRSFNSGNFI